jgi:hypothetical protein
MRRVFIWLAALGATLAVAGEGQAASLVVTPSEEGRFWAGTRLKIEASRTSAGRLSVRIGGTVAASSASKATLSATGCGARADDIASYGWSPEHHPAGRQAIPSAPAYQQSGVSFDLRLTRGKRHVSYAAAVSYGYLDAAAPSWTDCVTVSLARRPKKGGADVSPAFDDQSSTLYVSLGLHQDGRHVECGPAPAFCLPRRPAEFVPPALPDFPPAGGYPGSPGQGEPAGDTGKNYPYHVCPIDAQRFALCSAEQAAAVRASQ